MNSSFSVYIDESGDERCVMIRKKRTLILRSSLFNRPQVQGSHPKRAAAVSGDLYKSCACLQ